MALNINVFANKQYVTCPADHPHKVRHGFLEKDTVDLVIFDSRTLTKDSDIQCTSDDLIQNLSGLIKNSYPSAVVNIQSSRDFYSQPKANRITIKLEIAAYHAEYYKGRFNPKSPMEEHVGNKWTATTSYKLKVYDFTNGLQTKNVKEIHKTRTAMNVVGKNAHHKLLSAVYHDANKELLSTIETLLVD